MLAQANVLLFWMLLSLSLCIQYAAANIFKREENKKRVIGYVPFWEDCPSNEMTDHYTHILIAFASTYKWEGGVKNCDWGGANACVFKPQQICGGSDNPVDSNNVSYIDTWQNAGKKVIISVGGEGMGGHWKNDPNGCWDDCIAKGADHVVDQLVDIVEENNFDGVDINYEYFFNTPKRQEFLVDLTNGLREKLDFDKIISHAPANGASDASGTGTDYTEKILKDVSDVIDYVKPQYFNNNNKLPDPEVGLDGIPGPGRLSALQHYENLVTNVFEGDASKVVFGFCAASNSADCNQQCQDECVTGTEAAEIMSELTETQPCNGGAGFWVTTRDTNGSWSESVSEVVANSEGSCSNPTTPSPTMLPTTTHTKQPAEAPTKAPTPSQSMGTCGDGNVGNGLCAISNTCCSRWGWCGATTHCTSELNQGTCGGGNRGNGICPNAMITRECCSLGGECGTSTEYCNSISSTMGPSRSPSKSPTSSPMATPSTGFCNWGNDGTAGTATCDKSEGGQWCNASMENCENGCSGKWCSS